MWRGEGGDRSGPLHVWGPTGFPEADTKLPTGPQCQTYPFCLSGTTFPISHCKLFLLNQQFTQKCEFCHLFYFHICFWKCCDVNPLTLTAVILAAVTRKVEQMENMLGRMKRSNYWWEVILWRDFDGFYIKSSLTLLLFIRVRFISKASSGRTVISWTSLWLQNTRNTVLHVRRSLTSPRNDY